MQLLEDKGGRPDRNEPDKRVKENSICLLYGFDPANPVLRQFNGKECLVIQRSKVDSDRVPYSADEVWYECHVRGYPFSMDIRLDHLMIIDDSDHLIIEKMSKRR